MKLSRKWARIVCVLLALAVAFAVLPMAAYHLAGARSPDWAVAGVLGAYHDVSADILTDFHPWLSSLYIEADPHLLTLARHAAKQVSYPVVFGRTVTGESFIDDKEKHRILQDFAPLSVDMESAGIAHVCYVNKIPFLAVRTLTDQADHSAPELFEKNCQRASAQSADFVRQMLRLWATHGA